MSALPGNYDWAVGLSVHEDAEVRLPGDVDGLSHHHLADRDPLGWSLLGDQPVSQHGRHQGGHFLGLGGQVDAALEPVVKVTLAPASRQNLGFDHVPAFQGKESLRQACFFTDFPAIQDNGISLILSLEEKSLSLGRKSLSLEKNTGVYGENPPV